MTDPEARDESLESAEWRRVVHYLYTPGASSALATFVVPARAETVLFLMRAVVGESHFSVLSADQVTELVEVLAWVRANDRPDAVLVFHGSGAKPRDDERRFRFWAPAEASAEQFACEHAKLILLVTPDTLDEIERMAPALLSRIDRHFNVDEQTEWEATMEDFAMASGHRAALRQTVPELRTQLRRAHRRQLPADVIRERYALPLLGALVELDDYDEAAEILYTEIGLDFPERASPGRAPIAWGWFGMFHRGIHDLDAAEAAFEASARAFRQEDDEPGAADVEGELGVVLWMRGELDRAAELFTRAYEHAEHSDNPQKSTRWLSLLGRVALQRGQHDVVEAMCERIMARAARSGDLSSIIDSFHMMSASTYDRGDFASAETLLRQALGMIELTGDDDKRAATYRALALQILRRGDVARARPLLLEARTIAAANGLEDGVARVDCDLAMAAGMEEQWHEAASHFLDALAYFRRAGLVQDVKGVTDHYRIMCSVTSAENCALLMRLWVNAGLDPSELA